MPKNIGKDSPDELLGIIGGRVIAENKETGEQVHVANAEIHIVRETTNDSLGGRSRSYSQRGRDQYDKIFGNN